MLDVTEDGGVKKKIITPGSGPSVSRHAVVTFHCDTYCEYSACVECVDSSRMRRMPYTLNLHESGSRGLKIALQSMKMGEECLVKIAPDYGYGDYGCGNGIPPKATLYYEITLLKFIETQKDGAVNSNDCSTLPFEEVFKTCCHMFKDGNRLYNNKKYLSADRFYAEAVKMLESTPEAQDEEKNLRRSLLMKLYGKRAHCGLKNFDPELVVGCSRRVLRLDPADPKALYRCAVGLRELGEYEEAVLIQRRVLALKPGSAHVIRELELLEDLLEDPAREHKGPSRAVEPQHLQVMHRRFSIEETVDTDTRHDTGICKL